MALFRKFFYRKPPDGLLEISERVYVFDCCFSTDVLEDGDYKVYMSGVVGPLREQLPDASFMVFNFREGERPSLICNILSEYDMIVMDYPRQYEGCPLLTMEMIHHFLRSSESWLSLGQQNVLLMHCEQGGWPVLAFMLSGLLIYRKQYTAEQKTLDMIYKQAPRELLQLLSPLNPLPSQLRYLQYVSRRNVGSEWPPLDRALTLDCVIIRFIPNFDGEGGCRPIFRIFGQDPFIASDRTPKVLFSPPKKSKSVRLYKQSDCELVKIDIHCHIQGDVVVECINLDDDLEREEMVFRVMFNTGFIRSNILMLNRDEIDILWNSKDRFPKDFRVEVLLSEMDSAASLITLDLAGSEEKEGLPMEAFAKVQEMFSNVDWLDTKGDATLQVLQKITATNDVLEKLEAELQQNAEANALQQEYIPDRVEEKLKSDASEDKIKTSTSTLNQPTPDVLKSSPDFDSNKQKVQHQEVLVALQHPSQPKIISQRVPPSSFSSPVSYSNSLQSSPVPMSRYHSAPSILGITALLHDHAVYGGAEATLPVTSPYSATISTAPESCLPGVRKSRVDAFSKPTSASPTIRSSTASPPPPSPPPPPAAAVPSQPLSVSNLVPVSPPSVPCPPLSSSNIAPIPPPPSLSELSSPGGYTSVSVPPPRPPPSRSGGSLADVTSSDASPHSPSSFRVGSTINTNLPSAPPPPPPPMTTSSPSPPPPPPPPMTTSSTSSFPPPPPMTTSSTSSFPPPPPMTASSTSTPPPPPPPPMIMTSSPSPPPLKTLATTAGPPPPPPPPSHSGPTAAPPPPPPFAPPAPPPPAPGGAPPPSLPPGGKPVGPPPPAMGLGPLGAKGRGRTLGLRNQPSSKKASLKPLHWVKVTRVMQGSLWAESQKSDEASKAPEFDMSELESLFSAAVPNPDAKSGDKSKRASLGPKSDKVHLIDLRRANNCEIMLTKVKIPLPDLMSTLLTLDDSVIDADQIDNLIKFCPTKEEMELLKGYTGDKENLGRCEQFFLELMKVPRVESKLRVFSFKIQFTSQVSDLRKSLNTVHSAAEEIRTSAKLKRILQTILSLGNALNQGTARGSAIGFRLDSLLKLTDTRARNNKMTLMHYLCKVLAEKLPELLDFHKDLVSLEVASKIQLKTLAEEMQAISKGLEKVVQELTTSENDGPVSEIFRKTLKEFLVTAEGEVRSLTSLYSGVGRSADALAVYFGEDPARCPFEQVVSTLLNFVRMFGRAHEENCKQLELEKKKALKDAEMEKKTSTPKKDPEKVLQSPIRSSTVK